MHSIRFEADQNALVYIYEAEDYRYLDLMRARLGVSWDSEDRLIKHSLETLPADLKSLRSGISSVKDFEHRLKKIFFGLGLRTHFFAYNPKCRSGWRPNKNPNPFSRIRV